MSLSLNLHLFISSEFKSGVVFIFGELDTFSVTTIIIFDWLNEFSFISSEHIKSF